MKETISGIGQITGAIVTALIVLLCSTLLAQQVAKTRFYQQSRFFTGLFRQDSVGVTEMFSQGKNMDLLLKFAGAVTTAYINFELIPVNEAKTFTAIFESVNDRITIQQFTYQRKDLSILGNAQDKEAYALFLEKLKQTEHFSSVSGHTYIALDDSIQFQILCASTAVNGEVAMAFASFS